MFTGIFICLFLISVEFLLEIMVTFLNQSGSQVLLSKNITLKVQNIDDLFML